MMFKSILLLAGTISLVSSSYAAPSRDQAARTFGHRLDSLNEQHQNDNNNNDDQNSADNNENDNQGDHQENDENNQSEQGNELTPEQQLNDLSEDMKSVMLHIDRLSREIDKLKEAAVHKKEVKNKKGAAKKKNKKSKPSINKT